MVEVRFYNEVGQWFEMDSDNMACIPRVGDLVRFGPNRGLIVTEVEHVVPGGNCECSLEVNCEDVEGTSRDKE